MEVGNTFTLLDGEDYLYFSQWKWGLTSSGYARRTIKRSGKVDFTGLLHRLIMQPPEGMEIDHINGDKLDNRRNNLRICTRQQNLANSRKRKGTSSLYKGVVWDKRANRYVVEIHTTKHFKNEKEAARFSDKIQKLIHEEFAKLNFSEGI